MPFSKPCRRKHVRQSSYTAESTNSREGSVFEEAHRSPARLSSSSCRYAAECECAHNLCCCCRQSRRQQKHLQHTRKPVRQITQCIKFLSHVKCSTNNKLIGRKLHRQISKQLAAQCQRRCVLTKPAKTGNACWFDVSHKL